MFLEKKIIRKSRFLGTSPEFRTGGRVPHSPGDDAHGATQPLLNDVIGTFEFRQGILKDFGNSCKHQLPKDRQKLLFFKFFTS